jgi:hypothetical protein
MGAERPPPGSQRWVEILRRLSTQGPPERQARGYPIGNPSTRQGGTREAGRQSTPHRTVPTRPPRIQNRKHMVPPPLRHPSKSTMHTPPHRDSNQQAPGDTFAAQAGTQPRIRQMPQVHHLDRTSPWPEGHQSRHLCHHKRTIYAHCSPAPSTEIYQAEKVGSAPRGPDRSW